jgi:plastocyanin
MSVQYPDSPSQPPADYLPSPATDPSYNRRVISSSLMILIFLVAITTVVAFRASPGVFQGGTKVSAASPLAVAPADVNITSKGFVPATVSIKVGQGVAWTNADVIPHFVIADNPTPLTATEPLPNSGKALGPTDSYSYVFNQAGTYGYHDSLSPNFKGTVVVK